VTSITIPNSVNSIGAYAFDECISLTSVTIPIGVTSIGEGAFNICSNLTSVTIPSSVTNIAFDLFGGIFDECTSLTTITVDPSNSFYSSMDGVLLDKSQTFLIQYPGGKAGGYTIPDSVTSIRGGFGAGAFYYCIKLTSVTIPSSVTYIAPNTFLNCFSLTNVTIPTSVISIGEGAFWSCGLTSVAIPNGVTSIEFYAFANNRLTSVTMPNTVTSFGDYAFGDCSGLTGVYCQGNAAMADSTVFSGDNNATVYYLPGTTGWGTTFGGRPTALWFLPNPLILDNSSSFGVQTNGFGFIISWATNISVVVEACTNLASHAWQPVATNTFTSGWSYFTDSQWTNYHNRFYRLRTANPASLQVTTTSLPNGTNGLAYSQQLSAIYGQLPYSWSLISGSLPSGLTLATNGVISGAPTTNGPFNFTVKVTDALSATATQPLMLTVAVLPPNMVLNGGFEFGSFSGWMTSGNFTATTVSTGFTYAHSGTEGARLGPYGSLGFISQTLATTAGTSYLLSFWLDSPDGRTPNEFLVSWNGNTLFDQMNLPAIGWTNIQFMVTATGTSTALQFGFRDDPTYLGLDDINVVNLNVMLPDLLSAPQITPGKTSFTFLLSGPAGRNYVLLVSTNLSNWSPVSTSTIPVSGSINLTNAIGGYNRRFYRAYLQ
jgi:hypothetical protein